MGSKINPKNKKVTCTHNLFKMFCSQSHTLRNKQIRKRENILKFESMICVFFMEKVNKIATHSRSHLLLWIKFVLSPSIRHSSVQSLPTLYYEVIIVFVRPSSHKIFFGELLTSNTGTSKTVASRKI